MIEVGLSVFSGPQMRLGICGPTHWTPFVRHYAGLTAERYHLRNSMVPFRKTIRLDDVCCWAVPACYGSLICMAVGLTFFSLSRFEL